MTLPEDADDGLAAEYEAAWQEWSRGEDAALWDAIAADGLLG